MANDDRNCREMPPEVDVGDHERELAERLGVEAPEHELAHWATSNLAVALHAAGLLPPPDHVAARSLRRALLVSSARIFRLARAGIAVIAAGYEAEARSFDRSLFETRARRIQVLADESGELATRWLDGKLEGHLGALVRESLPTVDLDQVKSLYRRLSGDVHPDLRQFMGNLVREKPTGGYEMSFSPGRTALARRSLFLYAWLSAEATAEVGVRTGVDLPHYAELERAVMAAGAHMQRDLGPPAAK